MDCLEQTSLLSEHVRQDLRQNEIGPELKQTLSMVHQKEIMLIIVNDCLVLVLIPLLHGGL